MARNSDHPYSITSERSRWIHHRSCDLLREWRGDVYGSADKEAVRQAADEWEEMQRMEAA